MKSFLSKHKSSIAAIISVSIPILMFFVVPQTIHAEKLYEVLQGSSGPSATIKSVWEAIRNLINYAAIAFLIYVAFLNILRSQMNNYAIKKILPALVMGVILANFSFLICRFFVDLASAAMSLLLISPAGSGGTTGAGISGTDYGIAGSFAMNFDPKSLVQGGVLQTGIIWQYLLLALFEFVGTVFILILAFIFFIRNYIIYFLVALSPLAFMVTGIPLAKSAWNTWWTNFTKWTFMPVISLFWLWVGGKWLVPLTDSSVQLGGISLLSMAFAGVCFYLAITTPLKMGGAIMSGYSKIGKQAWGRTGGAAWKATGGAGINAVKTGINARYDRTKQNVKNSFYRRTPLGRYMKRGQANQRFLNTVVTDATAKIDENADKDRIQMAVVDIRRRQAANLAAGRVNAQGEPDQNYGIDPIYRSRVIAKSRKFIQGEAETPRGVGSDALMLRLRQMHAVDQADNDRLLSEDQLLALPDQNYYEVKAIINEIRKQQRQNVPGPAARANFIRLIPDAGVRETAEAADIAADIQASPAVGDDISEAEEVQQHATNINDSVGEQHGQVIQDMAAQGHTFEEAVSAASSAHGAIDPTTIEGIRQSFEAIRANRDQFIDEEMRRGQEETEQVLTGMEMIRPHLAKTGSSIQGTEREISEGFRLAEEGDLEGVKKTIGGMNESLLTSINAAQADGGHGMEAAKKTLNQMRSGLRKAKELQLSGAGNIGTMSENAYKSFQDQIRQQSGPVIQAQSRAIGSVRTATSQIQPSNELVSSLGDASIENALSDQTGHLERISEHMNKLVQASGGGIKYNSPSTASALSAAVHSSGIDPKIPMIEALKNPIFQKSLATEIGTSVVKAQSRLKIGHEVSQSPAMSRPSVKIGTTTPPAQPRN